MTSEKSRALLIVEDDLALQKQIKWSLDRFESVTAHDRESAVVQARRHQPAVVTMDLGLPPDPDSVSEGFKLLEQLLAIDGDMKVIVLTGQNDRANALRAVAMGAERKQAPYNVARSKNSLQPRRPVFRILDKHVLRECVRDLFPAGHLERPKMGFRFPMDARSSAGISPR